MYPYNVEYVIPCIALIHIKLLIPYSSSYSSTFRLVTNYIASSLYTRTQMRRAQSLLNHVQLKCRCCLGIRLGSSVPARRQTMNLKPFQNSRRLRTHEGTRLRLHQQLPPTHFTKKMFG